MQPCQVGLTSLPTLTYKTGARRPATRVLIILRSRVNSNVLRRGMALAQWSLQYVARSCVLSPLSAPGMLP